MPQCDIRVDSQQPPEQILQRATHLGLVSWNHFAFVDRVTAELGDAGESLSHSAMLQSFHGVKDIDIDVAESLQAKNQQPLTPARTTVW